MTRDDWQRAEPLLTKALHLPEKDREALLETVDLEETLRRDLLEILSRSAAGSASVALAASTPPTPPLPLLEAADSPAATPPRHPLPSLSPGTTFGYGRYVVVRQIGRGGMGAVFLGHDTTFGTLVALKVMPYDERVTTEARRAAVCSDHPHVATVHNVLKEQVGDLEIGVLVMEYVTGTPASRLLDDGPVDVGRVLKWGQQVAAAVAHAHDQQVLHCDLKPANIVITTDGHAKVLDFGISRATFDQADPSEPVRGTMPYMAPEQLLWKQFSAAGDIYSLGVTLYELLTARLPFEGDGDLLRLQIIAAPPPSAAEIVTDIPPELQAVLERAMAKAPDQRFRSARSFERALAAVETGSHYTTATIPVPTAPIQAPRSSLALLWTYAASVVGLFLVTSVVLGFIAWRAFAVVMRIDSAFIGIEEYVAVGSRALLAFVLWWTLTAVGFGILVAAHLLLRWLLRDRWNAWLGWWESLDPNTVAVSVFLAGATLWIVLTWQHYDVFAALYDLHENPQRASVSAISYASRAKHTAYSNNSAYLSFALILTAVFWLPRLQRQRQDSATAKVMSSAMLVVAFLAMMGPTIPRHFMFEKFRVLDYEGRETVIIGESAAELLLYDAARRQSLRVPRDLSVLRQRIGESGERTRFIFVQ